MWSLTFPRFVGWQSQLFYLGFLEKTGSPHHAVTFVTIDQLQLNMVGDWDINIYISNLMTMREVQLSTQRREGPQGEGSAGVREQRAHAGKMHGARTARVLLPTTLLGRWHWCRCHTEIMLWSPPPTHKYPIFFLFQLRSCHSSVAVTTNGRITLEKKCTYRWLPLAFLLLLILSYSHQLHLSKMETNTFRPTILLYTTSGLLCRGSLCWSSAWSL